MLSKIGWGTSHNNMNFKDFWLVTISAKKYFDCACQVFVVTGFMKLGPGLWLYIEFLTQ